MQKRFDGRIFNSCSMVVMLPVRDEQGLLMPYVEIGKENYVYFGRAIPKNKDPKTVKGAIKTRYTWDGENEDGTAKVPVWAVPIESDGYSLTNMMYGKDGWIYLAYDAKCYRAKMRFINKAQYDKARH